MSGFGWFQHYQSITTQSEMSKVWLNIGEWNNSEGSSAGSWILRWGRIISNKTIRVKPSPKIIKAEKLNNYTS